MMYILIAVLFYIVYRQDKEIKRLDRRTVLHIRRIYRTEKFISWYKKSKLPNTRKIQK